MLFSTHVKIVREQEQPPTGSIDIVMKSKWALEPRNLIMLDKLKVKMETDSINLAIFGLEHAAWVYKQLTNWNKTPYKTSYPDAKSQRSVNLKEVQEFLDRANMVPQE